MTKLEHAALEYLKALEGDGPLEEVGEARDNLVEAAILWAQRYEIDQVERKRGKVATHPQGDCGDPDCKSCIEAVQAHMKGY